MKPSPTLIAASTTQRVPLADEPGAAYRRTVQIATLSVIGRDAVKMLRTQFARGISYRDGRSPQIFRTTANDPAISAGGNALDFADAVGALPHSKAPGLPELLP